MHLTIMFTRNLFRIERIKDLYNNERSEGSRFREYTFFFSNYITNFHSYVKLKIWLVSFLIWERKIAKFSSTNIPYTLSFNISQINVKYYIWKKKILFLYLVSFYKSKSVQISYVIINGKNQRKEKLVF